MNIRNIRVPRRDDYEKRPVLSATIHPDIKRSLLDISERTGMSVSQVSDEVLIYRINSDAGAACTLICPPGGKQAPAH